jgi:hypothetical protein
VHAVHGRANLEGHGGPVGLGAIHHGYRIGHLRGFTGAHTLHLQRAQR